MGLTAFVLILLAAWLLGRWARAGYFGEGTARTMNGLAWPRGRRGGFAEIGHNPQGAEFEEAEPEERPTAKPASVPNAPGPSRTPSSEGIAAEAERLGREDPEFAEQGRVLDRWVRKEGVRRKEEIFARAEELLREEPGREDAYRVAGEEASSREIAEDVAASYPETQEATEGRRRAEAAERRRAHARGKRQLRSALGRFGGLGYWAFEDVPTDGFGVIDQLLVGPRGVLAVRLMGHPGYVSHGTDLSWWPPPRPGRAPERRPFEEDPHEVAISQVSEVAGRVRGLPWEEGDGWSLTWPPHYFALCFTEAEVVPDEAGGGPPAVCDVWNIERFVAGLEGSRAGGGTFGDAEQREAVRTIAAAYEARPWLIPEGAGEAQT